MTWKRPTPPCRFDGNRFLRRHGHEHRRPLHALRLVDGRDGHRVRRGVADVGVRLGVVVGRLVLEPLGERLVLLRGLGGEVDLLEVRDHLAELAELVEDELARAPGRRGRSPRACRAPRGSRGRAAGCCRRPSARRGRSRGPRPGPSSAAAQSAPAGSRSASSQSARSSRAVDLADHEAEDADDRLDLRAVEEPVQALDDERDVAAPQLVRRAGSASFATDGTARRSPTTTGRAAPPSAGRGTATPRMRLDAVADPRRLRVRVVERRGRAGRRAPSVWCPAATIAFGSRSPAGMRSATDRPTSTTPSLERKLSSSVDLPDAGVAVGERDDVRDLAAAPLVDRLVVVADDAQVRAELRQPADESLLQRVDVLVLVDDDVADVVPDVIAGRAPRRRPRPGHPRGTERRG